MGGMNNVASPFSPFVGPIEPITETDDEIRLMLEEAEIPPLLPALAYVTGDLSLLRDDLRPNALMLALPQGGLDEAQLAAARELALEALARFRDDGSKPAPPPSDDDVLKIMEFAVVQHARVRPPWAVEEAGDLRRPAYPAHARRRCPTPPHG